MPPVRDEESETQRKAHAKRVRETRRSTQGVTLDEIKSAEQLVKKKQQQNNDVGATTVTNATTTTTSLTTSSGNQQVGHKQQRFCPIHRKDQKNRKDKRCWFRKLDMVLAMFAISHEFLVNSDKSRLSCLTESDY